MNSHPEPVSGVADSPDGRVFHFAGARGHGLEPGGFVRLQSRDAVVQLGQIDEVQHAAGVTARGSGRLLGTVPPNGTLDPRRSAAFQAAQMADATPALIEALHASARASLDIGRYLASGAAARLVPSRFNRHTFWCGQSGSGKTYALGVVLEQLLIHTALPLLVLDPNADFVRLGEADPAGSADERALAARSIRVLRPGADDPDALRVRFVDLPTRAKGAVLHLHPLADRAEYNELVHLEETLGTLRPEQIVPRLEERGGLAALDLAARIENLGVTGWRVWAGARTAVVDVVDSRPDATVLDLGGFETVDEPLVVAMAVLDDLWAKRERRRPVLIVIDEAHNLCSPDSTEPLAVAVRERLIQIAAEGRKFGLWLLLSTQRPSRVHPSIISQCDNLALMKTTSPLDLAGLARVFGFVPSAMLDRSAGFRQGEALFVGGFAPAPMMVTMGERLTPEGGADVVVPARST